MAPHFGVFSASIGELGYPTTWTIKPHIQILVFRPTYLPSHVPKPLLQKDLKKKNDLLRAPTI